MGWRSQNTPKREKYSKKHPSILVLQNCLVSDNKGLLFLQGGECSDAWKKFALHCANGSSHIKGIYFDHLYSPVAHDDSFRINISITYMHRLTASILDISNAFQNKNVPISERVCASPPPYYLEWSEQCYPNVPLNQDGGTFCLKSMNGIQVTKPAGRQWNGLLDTVVTILKYKKITIDHNIYIKFSTDGTVSYLTVSTADVLNTNNKET